MKDIGRRIKRIEKELAIEDKTQWLRVPDPDNPGEAMEIKGCRTLAEFLNGYNDRDGGD